MLSTLFQIIGSLLILAAFVLLQMKIIKVEARSYLALNVVGSGILAINAYIGQQWGFLLLEGVWCLVSLIGLMKIKAKRNS